MANCQINKHWYWRYNESVVHMRHRRRHGKAQGNASMFWITLCVYEWVRNALKRLCIYAYWAENKSFAIYYEWDLVSVWINISTLNDRLFLSFTVRACCVRFHVKIWIECNIIVIETLKSVFSSPVNYLDLVKLRQNGQTKYKCAHAHENKIKVRPF